MSMSAGGNASGMMAEINVTPLVDVMLVLLIIFMITAPLMTHAVKIDLPVANPHAKEDTLKTPPLDLAIKSDGSMFFNDQPITGPELRAALAVAAQKIPQPELQIRADQDTEFKMVRAALNDAKSQGMVHIGFMTVGKPHQE